MQTQTKQTKYEAFKNAAKKYAGIALVASALAFPGYARADALPIYAEASAKAAQSTLPVESDVKSNAVAKQEKAYSNALANAKNVFNKGIAAGKLTLEDQKGIEQFFKDAKTYHETLPAEYKELDELVRGNLHSCDVGTTDLEYKLKKDGIVVDVEGTCGPEILAAVNAFNIGFWTFYWIMRSRRDD